jgi:spore coat polysaccharide biosynthesis protein SpsF
MKVVASIEARMGSSRLPGKSLVDIHGKPALSRLLARLRQCEKLDGIILATTVSPEDDVLEQWARSEGVACFRGSEEDVLQRVVDAQRSQQSDIIVEVTGDCTLLDPSVIDLGVETFFGNECDVVTNARQPSFPLGADVQVYRFSDLEHVSKTIFDPAVREHVSLYFYEHPEKYRIVHLFAHRRWRGPELRLQLDYPEDLAFTREVYGRLLPIYGERFGLDEIMALLREHPELRAINAHCIEKPTR